MFGINLGSVSKGVIAVADIESGSAAVAILEVRGDFPASVLVAERSVLSIEERTEEARIAGVLDQLVKAAEAALKKYAALKRGPVRELYVVMRAPWTRSETVQVSKIFEKETTVTDSIVGQLAAQALTAAKEVDPKNLIEAKVIRIELNGYPCSQPKGKRAKTITVCALASDSAAGMKSRVEASLQKVFPHLVPKFRSATWAAITVLRNRTDVVTDCFVVDMTSEATNLFTIRDGVATEHLLVPEGTRSILMRISESGMPEETLTKMRMLALEHCSDAACESLLASISHAEPELVRVFGEAIGACAALRRLPGTLVLMVHPDMAPWLTRFFSRIDFAQFTSTSQPFAVSLLGSAELVSLVQPAKGLSLDPGLSLSCALVNIEKRA